MSRKTARLVCVVLLSALLLLLAMTATPTCASSVMRLGVFDWLSEYDDGARVGYADTDGGLTASLTANFIIAVKHFNERNTTLIPDLAAVVSSGCNKTMDVVRVCDTAGYEPLAFTDFLQLLTGVPANTSIQAVLGPQRSSEAIPMSYAANVLGSIPIVSHWATSPRLAIADSTFFRTVPSDDAGAALVAELLKSLGYTKVAGLYESDDFGSGFKDALYVELAKRGITMNAFAFTLDDVSTISAALKGVASLELNVIVGIYVDTEISDIAPLAQQYGLLTPTSLWIQCAIDTADATLVTASNIPSNATRASVLDMLQGSLSLELHVKNTLFDKYIDVWGREFDASMTALVNQKLPPNGDRSDNTSCLNDGFSMQIWDTFFEDTAGLAYEEWAFAYDAVMALGMAMCATDPTGPVPTGEQLVENLRTAVDFKGLSGRVKFLETGDRDPLTVSYRFTNFFLNKGDGALNYTVAAVWDAEASGWIISNETIVFRSGRSIANAPPRGQHPVSRVEPPPGLGQSVGLRRVCRAPSPHARLGGGGSTSTAVLVSS